MSSNVERVKERLGIEEVIGNYVKLEKAGSNFKAKCPFHSEKTASFFISPDRGTYYCFGCGVKGDIFTFVQEFEGLDFLGALKSLAERAGIQLEFEKSSDYGEKEKLFKLIELATKFFEENLSKNKEALAYLKNRGLKEKTIKDWRLGFAPLKWQELTDYLSTKGYSKEELKKTGLAKVSQDDKSRLYDVFRGRIMFPIFDNADRPIAFSGRILNEEDDSDSLGHVKAPKYLNSPETVLFNKSEVLYGLSKARTEIRKKNYSILVEGQIDLVLSHQVGFGNTVSTSGTALTISQLQRLNRLSPRIILAYDGDSAGFRAIERGARMALSIGMNVGIAPLPKGEDPASIICSGSKDKWFEILKKSSHIIDFYLEKIISSGLEDRKVDKEIKEKVLPMIKILPSSIEQSRFISKISEKTGIDESAINNDLNKLPKDGELEEETKSVEEIKISRKGNIIERLAGILFWQRNLDKNSSIDIKDLEEKLFNLTKEDIFKKLEIQKKDELIFEAESYFNGNENMDFVLKDLLINLEEEELKEQFSSLMKELSILEKKGGKDEIQKLLSECQFISRKINDLNSKKKNF